MDFGQCESIVTDPRLCLEEKRCKIYFNNPRRLEVRLVKVDGCLPIDGPKCDYLLITTDTVEHYVELKGSDVSRAFEQIEETIKKTSEDVRKRRKLAFVITLCCRIPLVKRQLFELRLKRDYSGKLFVGGPILEFDI